MAQVVEFWYAPSAAEMRRFSRCRRRIVVMGMRITMGKAMERMKVRSDAPERQARRKAEAT